MNNKIVWLLGGVVVGIVFHDQIAKLPLIGKIPTL
jgi:hypothetical protein